MDALDAIHSCLNEQTVTCAVYRQSDDGPYDGDMTQVGTVDVAMSAPSPQAQVVIEGSMEDTSLVGHLVPEYDTSGTLIETIHVNDELRPQNTETRYAVRTKVGVPNELSPELWELGLERANATR